MGRENTSYCLNAETCCFAGSLKKNKKKKYTHHENFIIIYNDDDDNNNNNNNDNNIDYNYNIKWIRRVDIRSSTNHRSHHYWIMDNG